MMAADSSYTEQAAQMASWARLAECHYLESCGSLGDHRIELTATAPMIDREVAGQL